MITRMDSLIFTNSYVWISLFSRKWPFRQWLFSWKYQKSYIGWIRKNLGIHAGKSLLWFSIKNDNLGLKLMFWNFLEFSLTTNPCLVWPHMTPPWPKKDSFAVKPSRNSFTPFCNFTDKKNGLNLTKIRYQGHMTIKIYDLSGWWKFVKIFKFRVILVGTSGSKLLLSSLS